MTKEQRYRAYLRSYLITPENEPGFFALVRDIWEHPKFQSMSQYIQHADITRVQHIVSVAYLSWLEATERRLNVTATARGAMLHDLFYYDWHDGDWSHRPHGYRHPGFALKNARALNPAITKKEENIILRHMFPLTVIPPRYPEGWVVSLCDKYCATRELLIADRIRFRNRFEAAKGKLLYFKGLTDHA